MKAVALVILGCVLTACGGGGGSSPPPPPPPPATYGITATVSGLNGTVVVQRNGANDVSVTANGVVTLGSGLAAGSTFSITVLTQPANPAQTCTVTNGTGTLTANVSNVAIACTNVPLLLSATSPTNSATDVARNVAPVLTFSRALDASTVTPANITLASAAGAQPMTLATSSATVTVSATDKLLPMTAYHLAVSTAVRGSAAEQLTNAMSIDFVTRDGAWTNPALIEANTLQSASQPQLALDSTGNGMAIWLQYDGTRRNVWARRYLRGTGWQLPALLETNLGDTNAPQIAVNASGAAVAVWEQVNVAGITDVWRNEYTPAGGWGTASVFISSYTGGETKEPVVRLRDNGDLHVAYVQQSSGQYLAHDKHRESGVWSTGFLETSFGDARLIRQVVDESGNVLYIWRKDDGTNFDIYTTRRTQGVLVPEAPLETGVGYALSPQLAGDASGNAHAVWQQRDGLNYDIWTRRYTAGAGWGTPLLLETVDGVTHLPQITQASNGDAYAIWLQEIAGVSQVWSARFTAGSWGAPTRVDASPGAADAPAIAADASGNAIALWLQDAGPTVTNLWSNRYIPGQGWGSPTFMAAEVNSVLLKSASIAIDRNGDGLALWVEGTYPDISLWLSRFE